MENLAELKKSYADLGEKIKALESKSQYPIYCKDKNSSLVVRFDSLNSGEVVVNSNDYNVGYKATDWVKHTYTDFWQQLEVSEGLFDGQAVYVWDNNYTHSRTLRFWDAKNKCTFTYLGKRDGNRFSNYAPFEGNYTEWMLNAFNTLER